MPTVKEYKHAFLMIRNKMTAKHMKMLKAHYNSLGRAITERELADAAHYCGYRAANLQYGILGHRLCDVLGYEPKKRYDGRPIWTLVLAEAKSRVSEGLEFQWVMRKEVAQALEELEWV